MRYIILDYNHGIFLGTYNNNMPFRRSEKNALPLWSSENYFNLTRAFSFESKTEALIFIEAFLGEYPGAFVTAVDSDETYVDIVDLLKAGLHKFTHDMIDGIYMPNETVH